MTGSRQTNERMDLLADVAEMYFLDGKNQAQIAKKVGVTRSMVSRMLTDARRLGIVEININRRLESDRALENELTRRFKLKRAFVLTERERTNERLLRDLGRAGAYMLTKFLAPNEILGLAWGTAIAATVEALEPERPLPLKVVQLVGALGARSKEYDPNALVQRVVQKTGGEGFYLNAPFFVQDQETVRALLASSSLRETFAMVPKCDVVLLGIGSTDPKYSSYYRAGYVTLQVLNSLRKAGAVGDVCGRHFDLSGNSVDVEFHRYIVGADKEALMPVPIRLAVAGGVGKARPILGALRGKWANVLVTDSYAAHQVLELDEQV